MSLRTFLVLLLCVAGLARGDAVAVSAGDAEADTLAVSIAGDSRADTFAVSGVGDAEGQVAVVGVGDSKGRGNAISVVGNASSPNFALAVVGNATGPLAYSVAGSCNGMTCWDVAPTGDAYGYEVGVSGTGSARGRLVAVAGEGDADGYWAIAPFGAANGSQCDTANFPPCVLVSGTGDASGQGATGCHVYVGDSIRPTPLCISLP